jgi:hypothetical protein
MTTKQTIVSTHYGLVVWLTHHRQGNFNSCSTKFAVTLRCKMRGRGYAPGRARYRSNRDVCMRALPTCSVCLPTIVLFATGSGVPIAALIDYVAVLSTRRALRSQLAGCPLAARSRTQRYSGLSR